MPTTPKPKVVRVAVVGLGVMGMLHAQAIRTGKVRRMTLAGVMESRAERCALLPGTRVFTSIKEIAESGEVDAVLIATPHYSHTSLGIEALEAGLHVLVEKPVSVHKADVEKLLAAHKGRETQVFAAMFNQRTDPHYIAIRTLLKSGKLGALRRVSWIITNWFRTNHYYSSGGWRATWAGEGGGVLLNQCPHNLDLLQWMCGLPTQVQAHCGFGRFHDIEVEDDVTAYLEFGNGATGVFITSTGEAPGTNRLEISAEKGNVVYENDKVTITFNKVGMSEFSQTSKESFAKPATTVKEITGKGHGDQHTGIMKNFADAILDGKPLIAPAQEGMYSVELANAMLLSAWENKAVAFPIDGKRYERALNRKIASSTRAKR